MVFSARKFRFSGFFTKGGKSIQKWLIAFSFGVSFPAAFACPDLQEYYRGDDTNWIALEQDLRELLTVCLESSEFFALLGAAQLNNGNIPGALESLERSLLLEPGNGAAQIDYAQALFLQGDLFSAIELNSQLLSREDVPLNLLPFLEARQSEWEAFTLQKSLHFDILAGYDSNLNTAPESSQVTLTLSGEPVVLELNPEFQPVSGPYTSLRFGGNLRQLKPGYQQSLRLEGNGRISGEEESDILQLNLEYGFIRPRRNNSWQFNAGLTHLLFGGTPLYTASEGRARYQPRSGLKCNPYYDLAIQHQSFHDRSELNAIESKLGTGILCPFRWLEKPQQLVLELGLLNNLSLDSGRPGGDRNGWQANLIWRVELGVGELLSQFNYTDYDDRQSYSPILANGAERTIDRNYVVLQYRRPVSNNAAFLVNLFYQKQRSNIELFTNKDTSIELGFSFRF